MPKLKPKHRTGDISVWSTGRTNEEFFKKQNNISRSLFIDGKYIRPTRVGSSYWFHMVDGKIDHFYIHPEVRTVPSTDRCPACK